MFDMQEGLALIKYQQKLIASLQEQVRHHLPICPMMQPFLVVLPGAYESLRGCWYVWMMRVVVSCPSTTQLKTTQRA